MEELRVKQGESLSRDFFRIIPYCGCDGSSRKPAVRRDLVFNPWSRLNPWGITTSPRIQGDHGLSCEIRRSSRCRRNWARWQITDLPHDLERRSRHWSESGRHCPTNAPGAMGGLSALVDSAILGSVKVRANGQRTAHSCGRSWQGRTSRPCHPTPIPGTRVPIFMTMAGT